MPSHQSRGQNKVGFVNRAGIDVGGLPLQQDVCQVVVARLDVALHGPVEVARRAAEFGLVSRNQQLADHHAGGTRTDGSDQDRHHHPPHRDAGGLQGGQFVEALNPGQGKHGRDQRHDGVQPLEHVQRLKQVVVGNHREQLAGGAVGRLKKLVQVGKGIEHHVQPQQAGERDAVNLNELPQQVAIDDLHAQGPS